MGERIGIIELGSNSIRTAEFEITGQTFTEISLNRVAERLLNSDNYIEQVTTNSVIKIINNFITQLDDDVEIHAIATAAVRNVNNQQEFIAEVLQNTGIKIEIISPKKEAYYDYLAVNYKLGLKDVLIADIGGGSTEIITVVDGELTNAISINRGGVNITNDFFSDIPVAISEQQAADDQLQKQLQELTWLSNFNQPMVLLGGSSIVLFKMLKSNDFVQTSEVQKEIIELRKMNISELQNLSEIPAGIVDIINGGMTMIENIIKIATPPKMTTIKASVREGYLIEKIKNA
ncbi:exopolyphosphatase [Companilactobacillus sp. RD055328]|uniref:Ppx/GppA phosphatase family protein n=1 Tax=Companilactobacillus sp. RD055328 TaxID=2916634 RepID=UPI001FC8CC8E|nr:hypothetical protein [Companilactobacillus sp. RD055328]GKQ42330.1 exopolyphosphatase [Companilactobacillus sp. RD055328]